MFVHLSAPQTPLSLSHPLSIPVFMKWTISQEDLRQDMKHLMEITVQLINEVLSRLPGNRFLDFFFCEEGEKKREKWFEWHNFLSLTMWLIG